ncbi:MAG: type II toxin-antitoxin system Phd/YefM family antitoxin [Anaerolineales bacterium]|nr:type II toxin-antitoxin system Phd/YefM family antitoxin [Anaerolineales bacterium]
MDAAVSIGEVKRDISELVNRVAYGGERIVLTSRGKPKAVLVSIGDYGRLQARDQGEARQQWEDWLRKRRTLAGASCVKAPVRRLTSIWWCRQTKLI